MVIIFFKKRNKYIVEYRVNKNIYNFIIKGEDEKDALNRLSNIWNNKYDGLYPFPKYELISIKKINKRLES